MIPSEPHMGSPPPGAVGWGQMRGQDESRANTTKSVSKCDDIIASKTPPSITSKV
jgi:hypothetical protein